MRASSATLRSIPRGRGSKKLRRQRILSDARGAGSIETGTTNGGFKSDVAELTVQTEDDKGGWQRSKRVVASMNGGGAPIKVVTTNGGIRIGSNTNE